MFASSGDIVCQLSVLLAKRPWTNTTGRGCAALGRHAFPAGGRWGAVHPYFAGASRLLLYDLWNDPFATRAVNDEHPELVGRFEKALLAQRQAHQALATRFGEAGDQALDPEMVKQLQTLGYTR